MRAVNIEIATTEAMFAKFEQLERNHDDKWRWCLARNCDAGQLHDISPEEDGGEDICKCYKCGALACVPCDRSYHKGESCEAYQYRIKDRIE